MSYTTGDGGDEDHFGSFGLPLRAARTGVGQRQGPADDLLSHRERRIQTAAARLTLNVIKCIFICYLISDNLCVYLLLYLCGKQGIELCAQIYQISFEKKEKKIGADDVADLNSKNYRKRNLKIINI